MATQPYRHVQRSPLYLILLAPVAVAAVPTAIALANKQTSIAAFGALWGALFALLAAMFNRLVTEDRGDYLQASFGLCRFPRRKIAYREIRAVQVDRTTWLDGWGIHYSLRGGWVWNLWGWDCVRIDLHRGRLWLGTDDPQGLGQLLQGKLAGASVASDASASGSS